MLFADALTLGKPRRTKEGYLAVRARAGRSGVYDYFGREVDPDGEHFKADEVVKVFRPEAEVFAQDSVHSFLLKPITDDHPAAPVTADNWRDVAKGVNAGALRDGEYLAFDLVLMDAAIIKAVDQGKRELSNGYSSEIVVGDGVAPDGQEFQATQRFIRGNHIAVVDKGRAGHECRIGDVVQCDSIPVDLLERLMDGQTYRTGGDDGNFQTERSDASISQSGAARRDGEGLMATKQITFDGMPIEATDQAEAAILKLQGQVKDAVDARTEAEGKVVALTTDKATLEAKVTDLEAKVAAASVTPAKLRDAAKAYQAVVDKAKALGVEVSDDMDEPAIMKAAVVAKVGDASKDWSDEHIAISFATLSVQTNDVDPVRNAITAQPVNLGDAKAEYVKARDAHKAKLVDAWKTPAPAAA